MSAPRFSPAWFVRARNRFDLFASVLPCTLDYPRHGALEPLRFFLDLVEHRLGEVEALLSLVAFRWVGAARRFGHDS